MKDMTEMTGPFTPPASARAGNRTSARPPAPGPSRGAVLALARVEALRLLRHPAMLASLAGYLGLWAYAAATGDAANRYPVLQDESRYLQVPLLLLAIGTLLAANLGMLRGRRHSVEPLYEVLGLGPRNRTTAHLLSLLPAVALTAALALARIGYLAAKPGAVGTVQWPEIATPPATVLLAGALGVLLARLSASPSVAPLVLAGLTACTFVAAVQNTAAWRWFAIVAIEDEFAPPLPSDLVGRPAGWHLLWLLALAGLCAALALLRRAPSDAPAAAQPGAGPLRLGTAAAATLAVLAGTLQTRPLPSDIVQARAEATEHPVAQQVCTTLDTVEYCAFPEFKDRAQDWDKVVRGVLARTPRKVADARYAVRQRTFRSGVESHRDTPLPQAAWDADDLRAGTPRAVPVGTWWSEGDAGGDAAGDAVAEFSALFAHRAVTGSVPHGPKTDMVCGSRGVLVLWLAGQATDGTHRALRDLATRSAGGFSFLVLESATGLGFDSREQELAMGLLRRPADEIGARVKASWAELSSAHTSTDRAANLLGVPAPAPVPGTEGACR
ncbi:ABC transporter permease [Streptomyces sp. NPDC050636]|uniref:ABC transporter permease n=1 Tax=Streptomyces sp. NPDC050636 TaxID=3154510 RepID=UPI003419FD5C